MNKKLLFFFHISNQICYNQHRGHGYLEDVFFEKQNKTLVQKKHGLYFLQLKVKNIFFKIVLPSTNTIKVNSYSGISCPSQIYPKQLILKTSQLISKATRTRSAASTHTQATHAQENSYSSHISIYY